MATIVSKPRVTIDVQLTLTESEARALEALASYNDDVFIKHFYDKFGHTYLKPHEDGLRSLFGSVRKLIPRILKRADEARITFDT